MSLRTLLTPVVSAHLLSERRLEAARARFERRRAARGERHVVHYFHQVDDPYSALAAQALPVFLARHDVELVPHVVGPPSDAAAPERALLKAYARRDGALLASHTGLGFADPGGEPDPAAIDEATRSLVLAVRDGSFVARAAGVAEGLWRGAATPGPLAGREEAVAHLRQSMHLRARLGHYMGAMFHYGGEWYWGLDRLNHLESRLSRLGVTRDPAAGPLYAPDLALPPPQAAFPAPPLDFFFSFRSPYSAIVAPRVIDLAARTGARLRFRQVLPMVMRGLPVPPAKRRYIAFDAAREARLAGVPFGRLNDPVGRPAERALALMPLAEARGKAGGFVTSFMQGVWAEGIDAGSDRGMRRIIERAGLEWGEARNAMADSAWRVAAGANRDELFSLGLWGVPSFRVGELAVWGQDRLWAVRDALASGR